MKDVQCSKCKHYETQDRNGKLVAWCSLYTFPMHRSYSCGKFEAMPEKVKPVTRKVSDVRWEAKDLKTMLAKYFVSIDADLHTMPFQPNHLTMLVGENETFRLYSIPTPKTLIEMIYFLNLCGVAYQLQNDYIATEEIEEDII